MASPNATEVGLISELRKRFAAGELNVEQTDDLFLIRWIRARNGNLDKAEEMLRKCLKYREANDIDNILSWEPPKEVKEMIPTHFLGYDADNHPILFVQTGRIQLLKLAKGGHIEVAEKYFEFLYERIFEQMKGKTKRDGTPVTQYIFVSDLKGFSLKNLANVKVVELLMRLGKNFEANRPEAVKSLLVINAGRVFSLLFGLYKPILAPSTQAKMGVYSSPSKFKPVLQKVVPADLLPTKYGGSSSILDADGGDSDNEDDLENAMLVAPLPKAGKTDLGVEVTEKNSTVHWSFKTEKSDIGFVVVSKADNKIIVNETKVASGTKLVEGSLTCDVIGDYCFTFDNSNGSEAQELQYRLDVRSASGAKQLSFD